MTVLDRRHICLSPRRSRRQRGFVVIYFVIASLLLFGITGLAIDSGRMFFKKRTLQAAADAAAIAAAFEIQRGDLSLMTESAEHDALLNGVPATEVSLSYPPSVDAGAYTGNTRFAEVTIQENVPTTLLKLVGPEYGTVKAHAVAGGVQAGDYCMLALNRTAASALWIHGTDTLNMGCGIMSNSNSNSGLRTSGTINVDATFIGVSGSQTSNGTSGTVSPNPLGNVPPKIDPFISLAEPSYTGWSAGIYDSTTNTYQCPNQACVWTGQINVSGSGGNGNGNGNGNGGGSVNPTFQPGIHVFTGGLRFTGGNTVAEGVMFYSTTGNITFTGNSTLTITPMTSGAYRGISMFVSRSASGSVALGQGGTTLNYRGAFYMPSMEMNFAGTPFGSSPWAMLVADTIEFAGPSDLNLNYPPAGEVPNIYRVTLVR